MIANSKNNNHLETPKSSKIVNRKLVFFLTCSIVFGSLSFVTYKPVEASKNDYSFVLLNNSKTPLEVLDNSLSILDTEKSNTNIVSSPISALNNTKFSENQFALIIGTYKKNTMLLILKQK